MIQLKRESIATIFQIGVIIFIFSYSFPTEAKSDKFNSNNPVNTVSVDSITAYRQLQNRMDNAAALDDHYSGIKKIGLLYSHLYIQVASMLNVNTQGINKEPGVNYISNNKYTGPFSAQKSTTVTNAAILLSKKDIAKF